MPSASVLNPLTEAHCKSLDEVLITYPSLKATFEALSRCGMDCSEHLAQLEWQYGVCVSTRKEFNPLAVPLDTVLSMAPQGVRPLTSAQCSSLDSVIQQYPHVRATFEALQRCGHECDAYLTQLEAQYGICTSLKQEFNPMAP